MTGTTISGVHLSSVTLSNAATENPATVASGAAITAAGIALLGEAGTVWTLTNYGVVLGTGTGSAGVALMGGGTISNTSTGSIAGATDAVYVNGGPGIVTNAGSISGTDTASSGIALFAGGSVTNLAFGQISGGQAAGLGVYLADGGAVDNQQNATIAGDVGVYAKGASATVVNSGSIGGNPTAGFGVFLNSGGSVTNQATGTLTGREGVLAGTIAATVLNLGSIQGSVNGVFLESGGTVSNQSGGTVAGAVYGVRVSGSLASTLSNQGLITGQTKAGVGLFSGGIVSNAGTGVIAGGAYGIEVASYAATVVNYATVTGQTKAGVALLSGGSVSNSGTGVIAGGAYGIEVANYAATVVNDATITGQTKAGVAFFAGGSLSNAGSGTIMGGLYGVVAVGTTAATATNQGVIRGTVKAGVQFRAGGYVSNASNGTITGAYFGVQISGASASVTNLGSISSSAAYQKILPFDAAGVDLADGGIVVNGTSGNIGATWKGVEIGAVGTNVGGMVLNQGVIHASNSIGNTGAAVWIHGPGLISNAATGTIAGGPFGIVAYYQTTVVNLGTISGTEFAFDADKPGFADRVVVAPGAVFSGSVFGGNTIGASVASTLELASGAGSGTLTGLGSKYIEFAQVTIDSGAAWTLLSDTLAAGYTIADAGTLTNTGTIASQITLGAGAVLTNAAGGLLDNASGSAVYATGTSAGVSVVNAGIIETLGTGGFGVRLLDGGGISNASTATIGSTLGGAIYVTGAAGTVSNAGTIVAGFTHSAVDLFAGGYLGNTATGTVDATGGIGVDIQGAAGTVRNAGVIETSGSTHGAVDLFMGGYVSNAGTGLISSFGGDGVYGIGHAVTVVNAGRILGPAAGILVKAGGAVTNQSTATISGGASGIGVYIGGAAGTVINAGSIASGGTHSGVDLFKGGFVSNASTGTIGAGDGTGVYVTLASGTVVNAGHILGTGAGIGVGLEAGGYLSNAATGVIVSAEHSGVYVKGAAGTVINAGSIANPGTSGFGGVALEAGGYVDNTGIITSTQHDGVHIAGGGGTVVNAGTLSGGADAVLLATGFANRLVADPGAVFVGTVDGGNTLGASVASTLELASGTSTGTLTGLGTSIVDFGQITIDSGATWTLLSDTLAAGYAINDAGTLTNTGTLGSTVRLGANAVLINAVGATIAAYPAAAYSPSAGAAGTVLNAGLLTSGNTVGHNGGVALLSGGYVSNASTGIITGGGVGVIIYNYGNSLADGGTVVNRGSIGGIGSKANGVELDSGGFVSNAGTGRITGSHNGVAIDVASTAQSVLVVNQGYIGTGISANSGVYLKAGGSVSNSGSILGTQHGVYFGSSGSSGGTLTNSGYIAASTSGSSAVAFARAGRLTNSGTIGAAPGSVDAVTFASGYANLLVIDPGAVFNGTVDGGNPIGSVPVSTLELASGASKGSLYGLGSKYINFGQVNVDTNATWILNGQNSLAAGATLTDSGTLVVNGSLAENGALNGNAGVLTVAGGAGSHGTLSVGAGGTVDLVGASQTSADLIIGNASGAQGTVAVSGSGALLESNAPIAVGRSAGASGLLSVSNGGSVFAETGDQSTAAAVAVGQFGNGTVVVSGAGSEFTADGLFWVGRAGTGALLVENQGSVVLNPDPLGNPADLQVGVGNATTLAQTGGSGSATVTSGGVVNSASVVFVGGANTTGTLNVTSGTIAGTSTVAGGTVEAVDIALGVVTGSTGGGAGFLNIGAGGLVETLGTASTAFTVAIGRDAGASGTATVAGTLLTNGQVVVGNNGSAVISGVTIAGANGVLTVNAGGTVTGDNGFFIGRGSGATGTVTVNGGAITAAPPGGGTFTALGVGVSGSGTLVVEGGGTVTATQSPGPAVDIGINGGSQGEATVSGTGSLLRVNGQLIVGDQGSGLLDINNGGVVNAGANAVDIGQRPGGNGTVTVESSGTLIGGTLAMVNAGGVAGTLTVGIGGTVEVSSLTEGGGGTVAVSGGLLSDTGFATIGQSGSGGLLTLQAGTVDVASLTLGSGTVAVSGGLLDSSGQVQIGNPGTALFEVDSGGSVIGHGLQIESSGSSDGALILNGGSFSDIGFFTVGNGGSGMAGVTVEAGGVLTASGGGAIGIGGNGGTDTVVVSGGTFSSSGGPLNIAPTGGSASLLVENAGTVITSYTGGGPAVGINATGSGTAGVTVTGTGSVWDITAANNDQLAVGDNGSGTLTVSDGAVVNNGTNTIVLGNQTSGTGFADVGGGNAILEGGNLLVGSGPSHGTLEIDTGGTVEVVSAAVGQHGSLVMAGGVLDPLLLTLNVGGVISGFGTLEANLNNASTLTASGGALEVTGTVGSSGRMDIAAGASLVLPGSVSAGQTIDFTAATGVLQTGTIGFSGTIDGMQQGNSIVLTGVTNAAAANLLSNNVLQIVRPGGADVDLQLDPAQGFHGDFFHVNTVGANAVVTEDTTPCYLMGTRILTARGEVRVEKLRIGDCVVTLDGTAKPIKWIGRRSYSGAIPTGQRDVIPILIRQGALGPKLPKRDLIVSPLHALYCDGVLVPAEHLVNGLSIRRAPDIDPIRYFHIELDRHDVIYADGAPAETFVDCDSRAMFHNAREFDTLYPGDATPRWQYCAPRVEGGERLDAIKRKIDRRAGIALPEPGAPPGRLEGRLDGVEGGRVSGWAFHPDRPADPVWLEVLDGDGVIARVHARRYRADLEAAGIGDGRHGFELHLTGQMRTRREIRVRRVEDGVELDGSPLVVEARGGEALLEDARRVIAAAILDPSDEAALDALAAELLHGVDALRQARAARGIQPPVTARNGAVGGTDPVKQSQPALDHESGGGLGAPGPLTTMGPTGGVYGRKLRRALIIDAQLPRPEHDAGSQAILSHAAALTALGFQVEFVAAHDLARAEPASVALEQSGYVVHRTPRIASVEEVLRRHRNAFDVVYLHRLANAEAYLPLARAWQARARLLYCVADLHHVRLARQAAVQASAEVADEARAVRVRELNAMRMCDAVITHSTAEAAYLAQVAPGASVHVVAWTPAARPRPVPLAARQGVAAIGSWSHEPNVDAVRWLVSDIMPRVWAAAPRIELLVVGSDWPARVPWIMDPRVRLVGEVTSIETLLGMLRVSVAPLRFGAGLKGKVLDSFACEVPCVMTPLAAEGFPLTGALPGLVAEDAVTLAGLIVRLHEEPPFHRAAARDGLALAAKFSPEAVRTALAAAVGLRTEGAPVPVAVGGEG